MARRSRRNSELHGWISAFANLPWQVCVVLIPVTYLGFAAMAQIAVPEASGLDDMGGIFAARIAQGVGMVLQYLAPLILALAALGSWLGKRKRNQLLSEAKSRSNSAGLLDISWREFEQLVHAAFERDGYAVKSTADGADGGVDLVLSRDGEKFFVQCKQWRASKISVGVVRELFGVMSARGAVGGFVVGLGEFTQAAHEFVQGRNISLVNARDMVGPTTEQARCEPAIGPEVKPQSDCPRCGAAMVLRTAKRGANAGGIFYGCSRYPACKQTVEAIQP